jgi:HD-GYP domain-containing protein (c-di-GMP phosphodiesterase class II)
MTAPTPQRAKAGFRLVSIREAGLKNKLTLAFGFMSFIPILLVVWAMVLRIDLRLAIFPIIASALMGYFLIARRMIRSVMTVAEKVREAQSGRSASTIDVDEHNEIGELARAFNRITQELEQKIDELESSRQLVKQMLSRIGTAIISYEGIDNLLNLILENVTAALEAHMGSLLLVDGEKQELYVKSTWSRNGERSDAALRVKLGDGVAGWVAKEGHAMRGHGRPDALGFSVTHGGAEGAVLSVPLKLREKPIGVISVFRENAGKPFVEDDEMLLTSIGSQMAVAIENYRLNLDMERTYIETILALALAVEAKDPYSSGHSKRVGFYAMQIGEELGLDQDTLRMLNDAGVLHDVGKIGIKDEILLKATPLTPDEHKVMQQHPIIGEAIVKPVRSLGKVVSLVRHHHESYDGAGYPGGLKGEEIPLGARILAVADTFDSMVTDRPYRKRLSIEAATTELKSKAGVQYDPKVVDAFLRVMGKKEARHAAAKTESRPS